MRIAAVSPDRVEKLLTKFGMVSTFSRYGIGAPTLFIEARPAAASGVAICPLDKSKDFCIHLAVEYLAAGGGFGPFGGNGGDKRVFPIFPRQ